VPDRDTKTPRQVDVWAELRVCNVFPAAILISCKDRGRPLDVGDIEKFEGEKRSTGASMGVIFSRAGFTGPAVDKAKAAGIACCRLYRNQPADLPLVLPLIMYHCRPQVTIPTVLRRTELCTAGTWDELLSRPIGTPDESVAGLIAHTYLHGEEKSLRARDPRQSVLPPAWAWTIDLTREPGVGVEIRLGGGWVAYRAKQEAHLFNGSYCFNDSSQHGSFASPWIDSASTDPGPGWERMDADEVPPVNSAIVFAQQPDVIRSLQPALARRPLTIAPG
jgi:hypothetical protein